MAVARRARRRVAALEHAGVDEAGADDLAPRLRVTRLSLGRIRQELAVLVHELQVFLSRECADRVRMQGMADVSRNRVDGRARPQRLAVAGDLAAERGACTDDRYGRRANGSRNQALPHVALSPSCRRKCAPVDATSEKLLSDVGMLESRRGPSSLTKGLV